jgi:adiponectin receptor
MQYVASVIPHSRQQLDTPTPVAAYVVLNPVYGTPAYRWARTTVFFLLGICALVPVTHAYLIYGLERMQNEMGINWIALTGTLYVSGALI